MLTIFIGYILLIDAIRDSHRQQLSDPDSPATTHPDSYPIYIGIPKCKGRCHVRHRN